jgi:hypothetical protein
LVRPSKQSHIGASRDQIGDADWSGLDYLSTKAHVTEFCGFSGVVIFVLEVFFTDYLVHFGWISFYLSA